MLSSKVVLLLVIVASTSALVCRSEELVDPSDELVEEREKKSTKPETILAEVLGFQEETSDELGQKKEPTECSCKCVINEKPATKTLESTADKSNSDKPIARQDTELPASSELLEEEEAVEQVDEEPSKPEEVEEKVTKSEEPAKIAKKEKSNKNKSSRSSSTKNVVESKRSKRSIKRRKQSVSKSTGKVRNKGNKK